MKRFKLPLNLQLFAEEDPPPVEEQPPVETPKTYTQADIDALTSKIDALTTDMKRKALEKAGLSGADIDNAIGYITGTSSEEIAASIDSLRDQLPVLARVAALTKPRGIDPNPGPRWKCNPKRADLGKVGQDTYQRLKQSGKLRRY
ncbi:hypothetical protein [Paenibacillus sp. VMFN-D1]|uniref:hypothetical protein n=1 Tax=Paenibacillus sp. VMFN-D1 TaxID=2135608 RepID=UPI000E289426|nr:hypothetical protein [Paenibacillus sp. VMFN-D1]RED32423.1 hypothetical protein C7820_5703 [Paenibacillus sp. VMFN-D1]